jgi:hypothetical protein
VPKTLSSVARTSALKTNGQRSGVSLLTPLGKTFFEQSSLLFGIDVHRGMACQMRVIWCNLFTNDILCLFVNSQS